MQFIDLKKKITIRNYNLSSTTLIKVAEETNRYIQDLFSAFQSSDFDLFKSLGQRNISGFIGEIYKNILASHSNELLTNPHPDGRPDILLLDSNEAISYFKSCFSIINNRNMPIKDLFTPFKYGGIEIKCSIGSAGKKRTNDFINKTGHRFSLYEPRVGYINNITWWAHHSSSVNLLGLYYDYYEKSNNLPQIIAAFYSELDESDWNKVSHGNKNKKKTSNTSLNKTGLNKMKSNCLFYCSDSPYISQLETMNILL